MCLKEVQTVTEHEARAVIQAGVSAEAAHPFSVVLPVTCVEPQDTPLGSLLMFHDPTY